MITVCCGYGNEKCDLMKKGKRWVKIPKELKNEVKSHSLCNRHYKMAMSITKKYFKDKK